MKGHPMSSSFGMKWLTMIAVLLLSFAAYSQTDVTDLDQQGSIVDQPNVRPLHARNTSPKPRSAPVRRTEVAPHYTSYGSRWASRTGPWDFSGMLGAYNPGIGFEALAAYRIVDSVIENAADNTLSLESGIGYISTSDTIAGS